MVMDVSRTIQMCSSIPLLGCVLGTIFHLFTSYDSTSERETVTGGTDHQAAARNARTLFYSSTNKPILILKVDQCYKSRSIYEMTGERNEYQVYLSFEKTQAPASISSFAIKYNPSEAAT
ncbi:hypothetical protein SADUNF_Sadunf17G0124900 [Salix dunnii]|uniref:Uncharacterized protein n=1 Tax=Salix dunnii TaxID=1413687 RepID=A0A835J6W6_9ROSI|nr:hypothetical protein SADUNF_Sadunf17G0124900 [Salix dunnii]